MYSVSVLPVLAIIVQCGWANGAAFRYPHKPSVSLDITAKQCEVMLKAAQKKSNELGTKMNIAIVDAGGNLKAFMRQDGAWLGSIDIAMKKAKTARYFDMDTELVGQLSQPGKSLYMIEVSNQGLITFAGGVPLRINGQAVGAIGASGSTVQNDKKVATAGASALG